jgi:hypothetical protein
VADYQFNFWLVNSAAASLQGGAGGLTAAMLRHTVDGLTMSFDTRLGFNSGDFESSAAEREAVLRYKTYNLYRRHEPFYLAYPAQAAARLLPADYARFERTWREVDVRMQDVYPITPQLTQSVHGVTLRFDIHMVEIPHLDRLLFVAYYEPRDDGAGNRERCQAFFSAHGPSEQTCYFAWDYA